MQLKPEQIERLKKLFDKYGAFEGCANEQVEQILNNITDFYLTLANINLRIKKDEKNNK